MILVLVVSFIILFYTSALSKEGNLTCAEKFQSTNDDDIANHMKHIDVNNK